MFPETKKYLLECYNDACSMSSSHLLIETPDRFRLRGGILDSDTQDVYLPKTINAICFMDRHHSK